MVKWSLLLPVFSKSSAPLSKARPHNLDPRGTCGLKQSQGPSEALGHKLQGQSNSFLEHNNICMIRELLDLGLLPCYDTVSPGIAKEWGGYQSSNIGLG